MLASEIYLLYCYLTVIVRWKFHNITIVFYVKVQDLRVVYTNKHSSIEPFCFNKLVTLKV